jgi:hypothetical protein
MIARLNRTTRAGVRRLQKIIESADGTLLGVVATGAPNSSRYDGYGYGYKDSRARKRAERKQLRKAAPPTADGERSEAAARGS